MRRLLVVLAACASAPAHVESSSPSALDRYLAPVVAAHEMSGVVLIRHGDRVDVRSYGMANREHAVLNRRDTRFLIGSISKQFTAAAILILEQQGKLALTDHLDKFIADFPSGGDITLLQMLQHRSGISRDMTSEADYTVGHSLDELADIIKKQPLAFPPGTKEGYSNNAYKLLAYIVEKVSGQPFGELLRHALFDPLGMTNTGELEPLTLVPHLAEGYSPGFGPEAFGPSPVLAISNARGAASLYSTVDDLDRWSSELSTGAVLKAVRDKMLAGDGIGIGVVTRDGHRAISHDGVYQGYTGFFEQYPDDHVTIIYLGNTETAPTVTPLQRALEAIAFGQSPAPFQPHARGTSVPADVQADYLGVYEFFPGFSVTVKRIAGQLALGTAEGMYPLEWQGRDSL
ncbi:MAG TPA: serine hydrolase domain-containing protein, partial [Kofleriaceae bacterium]|nr:serine hydrolase domain-containing protein [Kofleriaceae bacterium]